MEGEVSEDYTLETRRWVAEEDSLRYSWLFDIIHDHTEGLIRYSRISGPYKVSAGVSSYGGDPHG
jgi:hypothetical protein